jgi:HPt (histidine-containing phosphotransfer) domain-containing protein
MKTEIVITTTQGNVNGKKAGAWVRVYQENKEVESIPYQHNELHQIENDVNDLQDKYDVEEENVIYKEV